MLLTKILDWSDITKEHGAWDVLVWMGVLVNMAAFLSKFGLMKWFADTMAAQFSGMPWMTMLIVLSLVYTFAHYLLASNSAHIMALFAAFATILVAAGAPVLGVLILLGALCYATFDLTSQAVMKVWATHVSVLDILWGAFVTGAASAAATWAVLRFAPASA